MNLCLNMCILTGISLEVFWDSCFSLHSFWVKNVKNRLFWKKKDFECIFDRFEVHVVTVQCRVADNKVYRTLQILYANCKLKAEFLLSSC